MTNVPPSLAARLRRSVLALPILVFALGPPAVAQETTGIALAVAEWLPPFGPGGGVGVVTAGAEPSKWLAFGADATVALAPGAYDLYWVQDEEHAGWPMKMRSEVVVASGALTEVRIDTGITLEVADWVLPRDPDRGYWGAVDVERPDDWLINWERTGTAIALPAGEYDFYWDDNEEDDLPAVWLDRQTVEPAFGGVGLEIQENEGRIVVVRPLPGGPSERAGLAAGDVIAAVGGSRWPMLHSPMRSRCFAARPARRSSSSSNAPARPLTRFP